MCARSHRRTYEYECASRLSPSHADAEGEAESVGEWLWLAGETREGRGVLRLQQCGQALDDRRQGAGGRGRKQAGGAGGQRVP